MSTPNFVLLAAPQAEGTSASLRRVAIIVLYVSVWLGYDDEAFNISMFEERMRTRPSAHRYFENFDYFFAIVREAFFTVWDIASSGLMVTIAVVVFILKLLFKL